MVRKIIACSDIHIPPFKNISLLKPILVNFINDCKNIVKKYGKEETRIVICGDLFDAKLAITNESILTLHWFLKELNNICKTIVVAGNHDFNMNNIERIDSLTPIFKIGDLKSTLYIDKELNYKSGYIVDDNIVWCLFSSFEGFNAPKIQIQKSIDEEEESEHTYVGLFHGDVNGAITSTNRVTENGLDPNIFQDCDFVIAGHIHKRQEIKKNGVKIVYCSSIKQKEMGESISGHGYVLWDISEDMDYSYEFIDLKNEDSGFYKFSINSIEDIENDYEELINL